MEADIVPQFMCGENIAQKAQTMMRLTSGESFFYCEELSSLCHCEAFSSLRHCEERSDEAISQSVQEIGRDCFAASLLAMTGEITLWSLDPQLRCAVFTTTSTILRSSGKRVNPIWLAARNLFVLS